MTLCHNHVTRPTCHSPKPSSVLPFLCKYFPVNPIFGFFSPENVNLTAGCRPHRRRHVPNDAVREARGADARTHQQSHLHAAAQTRQEPRWVPDEQNHGGLPVQLLAN